MKPRGASGPNSSPLRNGTHPNVKPKNAARIGMLMICRDTQYVKGSQQMPGCSYKQMQKGKDSMLHADKHDAPQLSEGPHTCDHGTL